MDLEKEIAVIYAEAHPGFVNSVRRLKAAGAPKSDVVRRVTLGTRANPGTRAGLLITLDEVWKDAHNA